MTIRIVTVTSNAVNNQRVVLRIKGTVKQDAAPAQSEKAAPKVEPKPAKQVAPAPLKMDKKAEVAR